MPTPSGHVAKPALTMVAAGLVTGISTGFRVPPKDVVPNAERLDPEPGNPGVFIWTFAVDIHGSRTSFRTWAQERTNFPREVAEAALAHAAGDMRGLSHAYPFRPCGEDGG